MSLIYRYLNKLRVETTVRTWDIFARTKVAQQENANKRWTHCSSPPPPQQKQMTLHQRAPLSTDNKLGTDEQHSHGSHHSNEAWNMCASAYLKRLMPLPRHKVLIGHIQPTFNRKESWKFMLKIYFHIPGKLINRQKKIQTNSNSLKIWCQPLLIRHRWQITWSWNDGKREGQGIMGGLKPNSSVAIQKA